MKISQNARLLNFLETHSSGITTLEAMEQLRILRLSQRVIELERLGYHIEHRPEKTASGARVIRYRLISILSSPTCPRGPLELSQGEAAIHHPAPECEGEIAA